MTLRKLSAFLSTLVLLVGVLLVPCGLALAQQPDTEQVTTGIDLYVPGCVHFVAGDGIVLTDNDDGTITVSVAWPEDSVPVGIGGYFTPTGGFGSTTETNPMEWLMTGGGGGIVDPLDLSVPARATARHPVGIKWAYLDNVTGKCAVMHSDGSVCTWDDVNKVWIPGTPTRSTAAPGTVVSTSYQVLGDHPRYFKDW